MPEQPTSTAFSSDPLVNRLFLSPDEKKDKEKGKAIVKAFYNQQTSDDSNLNFFKARNARWVELLKWAKGSQNMTEFLDFMNVSDGNKAYVNIDMTQQRIAAQFISTLVESMSKNKTYPCVNAIDDGSLTEKEQREFDALFRMHDIETIKAVQQEFGVEVEPPNAYVPDDEISAKVYFELEDRLPKEIRMEKMLEMVRNQIHFDNVLNRKGIYDMVVLNMEATKIEKVAPKTYLPRKCVPANTVYNFFMNDTGDCEVTMIGEFYNLKAKDIRSKYGKSEERIDGLTEEQIFNLIKLSTNKAIGSFNHTWNNQWASPNFSHNRPYDDNSILVFDCEINCGEDVYFVSKKDSFGKDNYQAKKNVPYQTRDKNGNIVEQPKPEDVEIIKRPKNSWMRGVYAPYGDVMLFWGAPDIIITPYTEVYKPLSSYTINIPNNDGEYVPSLFERIMEPLKEYTITKLKRKQLIAQVRPSGIRIDVESARNLDLGSGNTIAWEEVVRIFNQTGNELWSSKGVNLNESAAPPLSNTVQDVTISKIMELTNVLAGIVAEIRSLIGVPIYRDGSDVGDRTAARLAEGQNQSSYNVTDFVLNAHNQLWEETYYKLCLLHWNDIVKSEPETKDDMLNTRFEVSVKMKATEYQKQLLEQDIQRYSQVVDANGNPALSPKDALWLREIDNFKLAQYYLATTFEKNRRIEEEKSAKLQEQNGEIQKQTAEQSAQAQKQLQDEKLKQEKELKEFEALQQIKIELIKGSFLIAGKSENAQMPKWLTSIVQQVIPNITIPLAQENRENQQEIVAGRIQEQMAIQQAAQQQQEQQQSQQQQPMQSPGQ